jgi:hypothetical protein
MVCRRPSIHLAAPAAPRGLDVKAWSLGQNEVRSWRQSTTRQGWPPVREKELEEEEKRVFWSFSQEMLIKIRESPILKKLVLNVKF